MYAVIRTGGKQYRVAPGDVIRVETLATGTDGKVEFGDIVAVSAEAGQVSKPQADAHVIGQVMEQGRADKVLVFHYKRKKQYKKLRGHRQPFTAVRITEIAIDGQRFTAPELPEKKAPKKRAAKDTQAIEAKAAAKPKKKAAKKSPAKKATPKKKK